ncbi:hypothetical protein HPB49_020829 [Dermacentor silvarum]|uniref:Uncharacterized protein n=1 Tax=Dermacentor silvarum TaxID=543639 RepID=A0ACB8DKT4_DERSI|nr:hypothetical protein HPB49_020829 [Dermacentor silvarum]
MLFEECRVRGGYVCVALAQDLHGCDIDAVVVSYNADNVKSSVSCLLDDVIYHLFELLSCAPLCEEVSNRNFVLSMEASEQEAQNRIAKVSVSEFGVRWSSSDPMSTSPTKASLCLCAAAFLRFLFEFTRVHSPPREMWTGSAAPSFVD